MKKKEETKGCFGLLELTFQEASLLRVEVYLLSIRAA